MNLVAAGGHEPVMVTLLSPLYETVPEALIPPMRNCMLLKEVLQAFVTVKVLSVRTAATVLVVPLTVTVDPGRNSERNTVGLLPSIWSKPTLAKTDTVPAAIDSNLLSMVNAVSLVIAVTIRDWVPTVRREPTERAD
jgi:hypothetical protein